MADPQLRGASSPSAHSPPPPRDELAPPEEASEPKTADPKANEPFALDEADEDGESLDARRAFEVLEIRTPLEELEAYGRARIDTLARLGEADKAELTLRALELGRRAIARVTGASLPGAYGPGKDRPS